MGQALEPETDPARLVGVWQGLLARLALWDPDWRARTGIDAPRPLTRSASDLRAISNPEAFEAFAVALVSGNTRWDRIEPIRDALVEPFAGFDPARFAALDDAAIEQQVLPWFRRHKAGSAGLRAGLLRLRETARLLAGEGAYPSAHALIAAALREAGGSPDALAMLLGNAKPWKLPGFGIALAAEALRLLGFDLCKPDRHVLRAVASWGLVAFARWDQRGEFTAPEARPAELLATMRAVRALAAANGVETTHASSVIWTAGAVSGARLTNAQLAAIADDAERQVVGQSAVAAFEWR
jgi:hypothetical protein